jgi:hypothetical protein
MNLLDLQTQLSDQLYTCTDNYAAQAASTEFCCSASAPTSAASAAATAGSSTPRFSHRALQTLWQARLQMRSRPRSRPKILSLGELLRATTANGLHSPRPLSPDHRISGQLSSPSSDCGRDLRDQSRALIPARCILRNRHESCPSRQIGSLRCRSRHPASRQHALRLARPRNRREGHCGGRK